MSSQDFLNIEQLDDGVLHLELKKAPVNALTATSLRGLGNLFQELGSDSNVAVVLLSSGLKVFSAGLNLKEAQNFDIKQQSDIVDAFHQCFLELYGFPKPLICAVEGAAIAGGLFPVCVQIIVSQAPRLRLVLRRCVWVLVFLWDWSKLCVPKLAKIQCGA